MTVRPALFFAISFALLLMSIPGRSVAADTASFLLRLDSRILIESSGETITTHVSAGFIIDETEVDSGQFNGSGRMRYVELSGIPAIPTDGVMTVFDMRVSANDGTVVLDWTPGGPPPSEWVPTPPEIPPSQLFQWLAAFSSLHEDEFNLATGFYQFDDWEYPDGDIYARKEYSRSRNVSGAIFNEQTTIELISVTPPRIDEIVIESQGSSVDDPETGEKVELTANLFVPTPFEVERCTWTGNNFTGSGNGDPDDNCRWSYEPRKGEGPKRETYGDKDLQLTVVYKYGPESNALEQSKSEAYKVFFPKKEDDNSNSQPNWFDYWGDDGAVPGLDDSDVGYDASQGSIAYASSGTVFMGPAAAEADGPLTVPQNDYCPGGNFPGGMGIDLAALTLAHERKHIEVDNLVGDDADGDDVPDIAESATNPDDPDSCNLAAIIDPDYATYGDNEFLARQAELGVTGVAGNDWALPGRQSSQAGTTAGNIEPAASGFSFMQRGPRQQVVSLGYYADLSVAQALTGQINSETLDTDSDGLFNLLRLQVEVDVDEARNYAVIAWVADDEGSEILWARSTLALTAGIHVVELDFEGPDLYRLGAANPIQVARVELFALVDKHSVLRDTLASAHTTGAISAEFDPPPALLGSVLSESTFDQNGDGLYDALDLIVNVEIFDPGTYELSAVLAGSGLSVLASANVTLAESQVVPSAYLPLAASMAEVLLSFDGAAVFYHREDGPFELIDLRLRDASDGKDLDFKANPWTTSAYLHTEFQQTAVAIDETSYVDMGGELDEEGKFTTLEVSFDIGSMAPGPYVVSGRLEDASGRTIARAAGTIGLGGFDGFAEVTEAHLSFSGAEIVASGIDGPYQLADVIIVSDAGQLMDQNPTPHLTDAYLAGDFSGPATPGEELIFRDGFE